MKGSFKLNWLVGQFVKPKLIRAHFKVLKNPLAFYWGALFKLFPFYKNKITTLQFKDGYKIRVYDFMSFYIYAEIFIDKCYDVALNKERPVIFDVGANTGFFALRMKQLYPNSIIYCYEPYPPCIAQLKETIDLNQLENVQIEEKAISDVRGKSRLYIHPTNIGGHSIFSENVSEDFVEIEAITLEEVTSNMNCDLLKLDCEGAEYQIIKSLNSHLSKKINMIIYEPTYDSYNINDLNSYLGNKNYIVERQQSLYLAIRNDSK